MRSGTLLGSISSANRWQSSSSWSGPAIGDAAELDKLSEEAFEACWGDDLEDSAGVVAGVPERVPLSARFMDEISWACLEVIVTQQCAHAALDDEAVFVLVVVAV